MAIKIYEKKEKEKDVFIKLENSINKSYTGEVHLVVVDENGNRKDGGYILTVGEKGITIWSTFIDNLGIAKQNGYVRIMKC